MCTFPVCLPVSLGGGGGGKGHSPDLFLCL